MKIAIYSTEKLQRIDAGSYFLEVKKLTKLLLYMYGKNTRL